MVFTCNSSENQRYEVSLEAHEMDQDESRPLQSAMAEEWGTVLMQRAVAVIGVKRAARSRSTRLADRSARLRAKLGVPASDDEGSSEDEPLVRRVRMCVEVPRDDFLQQVQTPVQDDFAGLESLVRATLEGRSPEWRLLTDVRSE
ncbi:hypothetical protein T484DRAFT_2027836 [Baffinella frigidus]|nr:hypothetical protein T484DRAFT_2027836 [Cryptophyta sp. CCMP2293]